MSSPPRDPRVVGLMHYPWGKITVLAHCDEQFHDAAEKALARSIRVTPSIDFVRLAAELKQRGVPGDVALELFTTVWMDDELYSRKEFPR